MKNIFSKTLTALVLLAAASSRAWTYADGDVLLIFRDGIHDVEFDLGNIAQFTGHTNGYTTTVTNWSPSLVTGAFGADWTTNGANVTVLLVAATTTNAWISGIKPNTTAYDPGTAGLAVHFMVRSTSVGACAQANYAVPTNSVAAILVISVVGSGNAAKYKYASYDYIVSGWHLKSHSQTRRAISLHCGADHSRQSGLSGRSRPPACHAGAGQPGGNLQHHGRRAR